MSEQFYTIEDDRDPSTRYQRKKLARTVVHQSTVRPRFTNQEAKFLVCALNVYASHLQILQAEFDKNRLLVNMLWQQWKHTSDRNVILEYWKVRDKVEAHANKHYEAKAECALLLARRLGTIPEGHRYNSASKSRFALRHLPEYALLPYIQPCGPENHQKR
jgi:hypothetical protein